MKNENTQPERIKLALIPVLGLVLLAVLFSSGEEASSSEPYVDPYANRQSSSGLQNTKDSQVYQRRTDIQWPERTLDTIVSHNPFVLVTDNSDSSNPHPNEKQQELFDGSRQAAIESGASDDQINQELEAERIRIQTRIQAVQNQRVSMIFQGPKGMTAMLGDRLISEGDLLEDGIRVTHITNAGITLSVESPAVAGPPESE